MLCSVSRKHVLPFMFEDLGGGEVQVFITDITVINSGKTGHRGGGTRFSTSWLWKPQHILTVRLKLFMYFKFQVPSQTHQKMPQSKYECRCFLTFFCLLLFSSWPAGGLVLHALQRSQRHVEVTVRTAPERA